MKDNLSRLVGYSLNLFSKIDLSEPTGTMITPHDPSAILKIDDSIICTRVRVHPFNAHH